MINAIIGKVVFINGQNLVLRTGGVEYSITVSSQTGYKISMLDDASRSELRILTHLQHREDEMCLFGFSSEDERALFWELIKVSGIGPKQAMKILSGASVTDFISALDGNDIKFLSRIPGLGLKTAQKIVLALKDKLVGLDQKTNTAMAQKGEAKRYEDLIVALTEMGYDRKKVVQTISELEKQNAEVLAKKSLHEQEEYLFRLTINAL